MSKVIVTMTQTFEFDTAIFDVPEDATPEMVKAFFQDCVWNDTGLDPVRTDFYTEIDG